MATAAPVTERIEALDFVRGAALFGILIINIIGFGLPQAYFNPRNAGGAEGADLWAWIIATVGFEGTQRALFSILFGAGVILFTSRLEKAGRSDAADLYLRRSLWLIAFGCVNSFLLLWTGDILYFYGIVGLFLYVFRNLAAKSLLAIGIGALLAGAAWNAKETSDVLAAWRAYQPAAAAQAAGETLTDERSAAISAWQQADRLRQADPADIAAEVEAKTSGYWSAMRYLADENMRFQSWFLYRYFTDIFGMMIIGMALFKAGVLTLARPTRLYLAMIGGGYAIGLATNIAEVRWILRHDFATFAFAQAEVSYDLGRLAMTVGHLGALLLFVRSGALPWFRKALAAVGRMAFTNYLLQSVICSTIFIGFRQFGTLQRHELYYVMLAICAAQLIASPLWLKHYRFGPLEWAWRSLTYWKKQPFRRETEAESVVAVGA